MKTPLVLFLLILAGHVSAQRSHFGSWNILNARVTLAPKWEAYTEMQVRSQSFYADHFYHELKGGISYYFNKNFSVVLGTGQYRTYSDPGSFTKPLTAKETRLWQQLIMTSGLKDLKFEHRFRAEQRWFTTGYRNRFRYRLTASHSLDEIIKIGSGETSVVVSNEVFLNNKSPHFERNRFFAGFGYQLNEYFGIQPGYVYQYDYRDNEGSGKHFFQLTLNVDIDGDKEPF